MPSMKWIIVEIRLRALGKTMGKDKDNLCRQPLIEGKKTCKGEDLLTEFMEMCKEPGVSCTSEENPKKGEIRNLLWRENDKDIRNLLEGKNKVSNIILFSSRAGNSVIRNLKLNSSFCFR